MIVVEEIWSSWRWDTFRSLPRLGGWEMRRWDSDGKWLKEIPGAVFFCRFFFFGGGWETELHINKAISWIFFEVIAIMIMYNMVLTITIHGTYIYICLFIYDIYTYMFETYMLKCRYLHVYTMIFFSSPQFASCWTMFSSTKKTPPCARWKLNTSLKQFPDLDL